MVSGGRAFGRCVGGARSGISALTGDPTELPRHRGCWSLDLGPAAFRAARSWHLWLPSPQRLTPRYSSLRDRAGPNVPSLLNTPRYVHSMEPIQQAEDEPPTRGQVLDALHPMKKPACCMTPCKGDLQQQGQIGAARAGVGRRRADYRRQEGHSGRGSSLTAYLPLLACLGPHTWKRVRQLHNGVRLPNSKNRTHKRVLKSVLQ